jgi:hypothetical protein
MADWDERRRRQVEWQSAQDKAYKGAKFITEKKNWSEACEQTLQQAGLSPRTLPNGLVIDAVSQLVMAAQGVTFFNATETATPLAELYRSRPDLARNIDPSQSITEYIADKPNVAAVAELFGNRVWINPTLFNTFGDGWAAVVAHELLHNLTGLTDPDLQRNVGTQNISLKLATDCFQ